MEYTDWLEEYRRAWIERDANAAALLFTEDAIYREQPFEEPFVGREAIRDYWSRVTRTQSAIELHYGTPVIAGRRVAVEFWASLLDEGRPVTIAGEFLLLFAENHRCLELREYWLVSNAKLAPPPGWGS